ncbi:hypothetical protein BGZ63DRAFT_407518 [Mariannaea sp. PMI_226]|nr:hypothetical protein BGZ63DRAFT_407518 [Mariannaea sp. PMI_226]
MSQENIRNEIVDDVDDTDLNHGPIAADGEEGSLPIQEVPKRGRRRKIWVWICCRCCHGGMKVQTDPCPHCGIPRCPACPCQEIWVRVADGTPDIEDEVVEAVEAKED